MPLMMVTLPLVLFTMLPGHDVNIGTSVDPSDGHVFYGSHLVEGKHLRGADVIFQWSAFVTERVCLGHAMGETSIRIRIGTFRDGDQWELGRDAPSCGVTRQGPDDTRRSRTVAGW